MQPTYKATTLDDLMCEAFPQFVGLMQKPDDDIDEDDQAQGFGIDIAEQVLNPPGRPILAEELF